uniref:Et5 n=1 Tax=Arundo donax TaxID=35708 RepID=A0A0A9F515_ARUDO
MLLCFSACNFQVTIFSMFVLSLLHLCYAEFSPFYSECSRHVGLLLWRRGWPRRR